MKTSKTPLPQVGGSFIREPDGTLHSAKDRTDEAPSRPAKPETQAENSSRRAKKPVKED
ncbi:hypothetical protein JI664_22380 [Rhodobacter sp. NTK016B]|uniref:hypothetical protein n=1 Tax=Rhodobacter sp. NTK016B TaxID=2759676 RepID=UPI001A8D3246|nr:hypothetical protein [Rhodobacter sp. NTK016B]MBN8294734.1 hypothetical protein [Rhodobacter sp. NTK016B]